MSIFLSFNGLLRNCKILSRLSKPLKNDVLFSSKSAEVPLATIVRRKLKNALQPEVMKVVDDNAGRDVPRGTPSHVRVCVVSPLFTDKNLVERHRLINDALQEELKGPIHALTIFAIAPSEASEELRIGLDFVQIPYSGNYNL